LRYVSGQTDIQTHWLWLTAIFCAHPGMKVWGLGFLG